MSSKGSVGVLGSAVLAAIVVFAGRLDAGGGPPSSPVFGLLDLTRLGVMGHSYGGATTLIVSARDPRVKAAVSLEPGTKETYHATVLGRAAQVTIPIEVQGGEYDQVVSAAHWAH